MPSGASCDVIMAMGKTPCEVIVAKTPVSARLCGLSSKCD